MKKSLLIASFSLAGLLATSAFAKLPAPAPLDDAGKAKAAEAAAKTAWGGKMDGYNLCMSMNKSAAHFQKTAASLGKTAKPATATPPCADPGPFVSAGAAPAAVSATAVPAAPAAKAPAAAPAKKS